MELMKDQIMYQEELLRIKQENKWLKTENKKIKAEVVGMRKSMEKIEKERIKSNYIDWLGIHIIEKNRRGYPN